jgi:hypothetical protein
MLEQNLRIFEIINQYFHQQKEMILLYLQRSNFYNKSAVTYVHYRPTVAHE